jgi:shikimate kinase
MPISPTAPPQNIILIGFMASGKSTVGREIASELGFEFVDTDDCIVSKDGRTIPGIFAESGEAAFRRLESAALESLAGRRGLVISTGGGIVLDPRNRERLKQLGFVAWLDAPEKDIVERVSRNRNRPLVQTENPAETVARLLRERRPRYAETADLALETGGRSVRDLARAIIDTATARAHGGGRT